jgi:hypothetical protein
MQAQDSEKLRRGDHQPRTQRRLSGGDQQGGEVPVRPATWDWVTNGNPLVGRIPGQLNPNNEQIALIQAMDNLVRERAVESNTAVRTSPMDIAVGTKQAVTSLRFVPRRQKVYRRVRVVNSQLRRE